MQISLDQSARWNVYAVATVGRTGLWAVDFAPSGFFASPPDEHSSVVIDHILDQLRVRQVRRFEWNVRYDHESLAMELASRLPAAARVVTQALTLRSDYDESFSQFNATIRNQVRKARKSGVVVATSSNLEDLEGYYAIHEQLAASKGGYGFMFPKSFLAALVQSLKECRFLTATIEGRLVGGGLFLRDGNSVFYLHGAHDHRYSKQFPMCAVIDSAIQWAYQVNATHFNFGGSAGIQSLERFKSFWGAESVQCWRFTWRNPIWRKLDGAKRWIQKLTHSP